MVARRFLISGIVQGVGFRFFVMRAAARHHMLGTVRNMPDGRVEVAFLPTDLVAGRYPAEVQITKPGPIVLTSEFFVADIREQVI